MCGKVSLLCLFRILFMQKLPEQFHNGSKEKSTFVESALKCTTTAATTTMGASSSSSNNKNMRNKKWQDMRLIVARSSLSPLTKWSGCQKLKLQIFPTFFVSSSAHTYTHIERRSVYIQVTCIHRRGCRQGRQHCPGT